MNSNRSCFLTHARLGNVGTPAAMLMEISTRPCQRKDKMKIKIWMAFSLAWIALFLTGCGSPPSPQTAAIVAELEVPRLPSTEAASPLPAATNTPPPAATDTPQATAAPDYRIISPENAASLQIVSILTGHGCSVFSLTFSPDSQTLASTSCDQTLRLWDRAGGWQPRPIGGPAVEFNTTFSPDSSLLAAWSNDNTITVYDTASGSTLYTLAHSSRLYGADISPDGRTLAAAGEDGTIRLWDLATRVELPAWSANLGEKYGSPIYVHEVSFSPDGSLISSADGDDKVRLWDVATATVLRSIDVADLISATFSMDGRTLVVVTARSYNYSNDSEYIVKLYDVASGNRLNNFNRDPDKGHDTALSPDGRILAVALGTYKCCNPAADGMIVLFDTATGSEILRLPGGQDLVSAIAFSADGRLLASGGSTDDRTIRIWAILP